ncbi:NRDE family protein [Flagellimonas myxillae]|uniref:NRDE family protein n=1 Tax=Flagellimonas myxillae TaxID=2942214 RepID=UPI00201F2E6C|nr:NRDE family protein [Muricauda myxillae]MCL6268249.1 NRDE family protein [Muricauda myxillae]
MCTVSYISPKEGCFITSNRDEHIARPVALEPKLESINGVQVVFPRDPLAGGTWFAMNEFGTVAVLLNGAFENHERVLPYVKSRGLVLLDVIASEDPNASLQTMDLNRIEPFTLILFTGTSLQEFRWDGNQKFTKDLDSSQDYIWSSVTLYNKEAIAQRESLFDEFITAGDKVTASNVVDFHSNNNKDFENGFIIDRSTGLKTFSVTQVALDQDSMVMKHFDLLRDKAFEFPYSPKKIATVR